MIGFVSGAPVVSQLRRGALVRSAFGGAALRGAPAFRSAGPRAQVFSVFTNAMNEFKKDFPQFASRGWGATTKAEVWNGRHAMFGFIALWLTAYAKGHNLIPNADTLLDKSQWGTLASLGNQAPISNERAIILVAHIHVLLVSVAAAIAPFSFQDKLLLEPGEKDPEPAGLIPKFNLGLTKEAEIWNGRLAMLGIMTLVGASFSTGRPILDLMNQLFGNVFY